VNRPSTTAAKLCRPVPFAPGLLLALLLGLGGAGCNGTPVAGPREGPPPSQPVLSMNGLVLRADESVLDLSVGDDHGVLPGMRFDVYRERQRLAQVRVVEVMRRRSAARALTKPPVPFEAGDLAMRDRTQVIGQIIQVVRGGQEVLIDFREPTYVPARAEFDITYGETHVGRARLRPDESGRQRTVLALVLRTEGPRPVRVGDVAEYIEPMD